MGIWWSSRRRNNYFQNPPPPHLPSPYYSSTQSHHLPPPTPSLTPPQGYFFNSTTPYAPHSNSYGTPRPVPVPPPPPPQAHSFSYSYGSINSANYANSMVGPLHYEPFYENQASGLPAVHPQVDQTARPPRYVDHQTAKKIKNDVNVHKDTLQLEVDEHNPDQHLVSFVFDAVYDGSITIFYFAKEEEKCRFVPQFPEAFESVQIPFQKGVSQKFCQPSGTGIDLGFFALDELTKPSPGEDVFPLVICAETCSRIPLADEDVGDSMPDVFPHMQITQAIIEKNNGGSPFQVKVVKQILWIDGVRYELRELYGIGSSAAAEEGYDDDDPGKECVICMTEPKDTVVLPCRHMCMCSECAKALQLQSNKCPICRQSIEELIEIKINNGNQ